MATEKRLIDANKPIAETESIINFRLCHHMPTEDYESFLNYLKKQPTVDAVEVKHGRWEWDNDDIYRCSNCYEKSHVKEVMGQPDWNYCPNCGANMKGK